MRLAKDGYHTIMLSTTDHDVPNTFSNGFDKYSDFKMLFNGRKATLSSCRDNVMGRTVAIKTLKEQFKNSVDDRRRFLREARVTAQLAHTNTIPVYEIGCDDKGCLFFTMKLLLGEDLYDVIKRVIARDPVAVENYPITEFLEVFLQVCQAVGFAHAHGVVHRDLKPENVWLGYFGEVVLLDWGVSKVWGLADPPWEPGDFDTGRIDEPVDRVQLRTLTRSGQLPGTPLYMSPEQILGHKGIDERSDIFSLGVMLYELMTLKEPFHGATVRQTFDQIIHDDPISPIERAPERHIPEWIVPIIMKAISKEANDRYQSVPDLIDAIRDGMDISIEETD